ncbi:hypothetical protein [Geomicrobium sediminis]|uniref:Uncharacterized protein n=1 Tax=Geomicrobium sediminis TaxID=1347788 RepID=A0ABS2PG85_9BACL|nr:hypothetical protein [Geomicrobium sediminis]MBM7634292.1 hypothetical protein [Geomicrobium sediminis]
MTTSIFSATLILASIIIYMGTFITTAVVSGGGVDITEMIYSSMWDAFPFHVILSVIMLVGGLTLLSYEVIQNKK